MIKSTVVYDQIHTHQYVDCGRILTVMGWRYRQCHDQLGQSGFDPHPTKYISCFDYIYLNGYIFVPYIIYIFIQLISQIINQATSLIYYHFTLLRGRGWRVTSYRLHPNHIIKRIIIFIYKGGAKEKHKTYNSMCMTVVDVGGSPLYLGHRGQIFTHLNLPHPNIQPVQQKVYFLL